MTRSIAQVRRLTLVAALTTTTLLAPLPPAPAGAATTSPPGVTAALRSAVAFAADGGMHAGAAVLDLRTGRTWTAGASTRPYASASVVKTMIATRLLISGQLHGSDGARAWAMITRSDNAAAWALYPKVGRDHLLPWLARHYHLGDLGAPPSMPGVWGSTRITAIGMVHFFQAVRADPLVWSWLVKAMHAYARLSSGGEPNAFGIAGAAPRAAVKNGWDVNRDVAHPHNAIINTTGVVAGDRYAVAILAEGPGRLYYAPGEHVVTGAARRAVRPLVTSSPTMTSHAAPTVTTIVLDPGHNGGNSTHLAQINRLVYAGYGRRKPCNTTGTATNFGYPEHAFTWRVANRVGYLLGQHYIRVIMTRSSDTGVGPCVNRRAQIESTAGVAAAIAIHADGSAAGNHGFHLCVDSRRPEHATRGTVLRTRRLNAALHRALATSSGLTVANYVGNNGYYYRDDLAGLNLSTKPTAFLELGNMRNRGDANRQHSPAGRERIARAITAGILAYLSSLR
jgi:N-acetylmuramoyl-L-alanine amidase